MIWTNNKLRAANNIHLQLGILLLSDLGNTAAEEAKMIDDV